VPHLDVRQKNMNLTYRTAKLPDIPALEALIPVSVRGLQKAYYTSDQMDAALGTVFGVDSQLIDDGTYFVAEDHGLVVACGGWSKRKTTYGSDAAKKGEDSLRNPATEPAMIRAFFVHPTYARKGIGRKFLEMCESAIKDAGFSKIEIIATLAGEPLYASAGYSVAERFDIPLKSGDTMAVVRMKK
jgi:GNAT superfamily N-acetyltransferase